MSSDAFWMKRALRLARKAIGWTSPNPPVGAVIVKNDLLIAEGYHEGAGKPHAEAVALAKAGKEAEGSTLYVTLEPCDHYGRTPPCTQGIIAAKIKRVVIGTVDPNPIVNGRGIARLKEAGIEVTIGILEREAKELIEPFAKFITQRIPFVTLKLAMSADGKIATKTRKSKWLTGEPARRLAHRLRHEHDAVMVGVGTIIADDPQLNVRLVRSKVKQPIRVVVDSKAKTPPTAKVIGSAESPCIIATTEQAPEERVKKLLDAGAEVWILPSDSKGRVDLLELLKRLAKQNVVSVLVEGGSELSGEFLTQRLIDRIILFIAPLLIGGRNAMLAFGGEGFEKLSDAVRLSEIKLRKLGEDFVLTASVKKS
ncbi:MAG: bifunctional diaminohydroxyphosphoribosylaminopyrimidine deaminase/5-amino-6-(5-phosphoribosylamino)uracil reductase RibD [Armatimonadetes bacterium]|nr:bifunctional diaminohydroxyphosphoribosylaminopyrimidine deaminase/5-amino-6-(5-phosphoribosylamino)uracil reductase RibD [Armatimonadota bacterium]MDW8029194.1 bifunctional diaminohydroxyphosphoribosylaminopyrimidine deaminase/5-amino-6-(5-phosphoribosylamino)uracil reductase RibD [Armatimonadota bacterium]